MKLSPQWIREYVDLSVDDRRLAEDLTAVGIAVEGISGSDADTVFEMEIGTNRPDAMNHYGVAREAAAIYDLPLKQLSALSSQLSAVNQGHTSAAKAAASAAVHGAAGIRALSKQAQNTAEAMAIASASFPITVEEPQLCPRFTARVLRNTSIKPSPQKVVHRLGLLDQRAINNAVDATNYVLWEIGKPTHVFDMDLLEGGEIMVRRARNGETLKTLDGVERKLTKEDLVVADAKKPVGLAGVMGGVDTMITDLTKNVLIESAWWDPLTTRRMAKRHGLHTDASHRFERGADIESTVISTNRVAELILQSGGGQLEGEIIDVYPRPLNRPPVLLRRSEVKRILGTDIAEKDIARILNRLGFTIGGQDSAGWKVNLPSWRLDA